MVSKFIITFILLIIIKFYYYFYLIICFNSYLFVYLFIINNTNIIDINVIFKYNINDYWCIKY